MDPVTGYCYGCGRNNDEKKIWKDQNTKDEWKKQNFLSLEISLNLKYIHFLKNHLFYYHKS